MPGMSKNGNPPQGRALEGVEGIKSIAAVRACSDKE